MGLLGFLAVEQMLNSGYFISFEGFSSASFIPSQVIFMNMSSHFRIDLGVAGT